MERQNKNINPRQKKEYHYHNDQNDYRENIYHIKTNNHVKNSRYDRLSRSKSNPKSRENSNDRIYNIIINTKCNEMKHVPLKANVRRNRRIKTPDRNLNLNNNNNRSHHSTTPQMKKNKDNKSPYNAKITPNRIKKNLSEDRITQKSIKRDYKYYRCHYNKTPSPLRKESYQIYNNILIDNKTSNNSCIKYSTSSHCRCSNYNKFSNSNNNTNQVVSKYKINTALNDINAKINSIYTKNLKQNCYKKNSNINKLNDKDNYNNNSNKFSGSYNSYTSNHYLNSNGNIINQTNKGYNTSTNKSNQKYSSSNGNNIPYKHLQNSNSTKNSNLNKLPLLDKTCSFLEESEKLYFSNNNIYNKETKSHTHSTNNNSIGKINTSHIGGYSSSVSRGNNTSDETRTGKNLETIEEVHLAFVNMIQSSKRLLSTQEKNKKDQLEFNTSYDNITVIKIDEQDII